MHRSTIVCFVISSVFAAACVVGDPEPRAPGGVGDDPDAAVEDETPIGPDAAWIDCVPPAEVLPNGNHNPGAVCQTCHTGQGAAPLWTVAGTIFETATGGAAVAGATVTITDADGQVLELVTASNGNFYTSQAVALPLTVEASRCPDTKAMNGQPDTGSCNSCHGSTMRIHLP
jgi:hypothetical protein